NRASIVPPDAFCATAASRGLDGSEVVAVNTLAIQEIEGFTIDVAFDYGKFSGDISYTMMDSLEPNPVFGLPARLDGTTTNLGFVTPGPAGSEEKRQSGERPEWTLSALLTYKPTDQWIIALNPRLQGTEWAYAPTTAARLVDANGNRVVDDVNFGDYFVLNGSIQYFFGKDRQHRILVRGVNLLDENYYERYSGGASLTLDRAVVRGEVGVNDSSYYRQYGWNGKPRSAWVQYEYRF
ncbi:MAG: TonB-dependent receptor, partial [Hyphomonas sp.]